MASTSTQLRRSFVFALIATIMVACSTLPRGDRSADSDYSASAPAQQPAMGAQLWANNCQRCHNFRDPTSLSDAQWDVALMHMRIRANLTAEEYRGILEYIKSSN